MKTTPTTPASEPERGEQQVLDGWPTVKPGRCRNAALPKAARPITLAVTDDSTTMPNAWAVKSARISSMAKNTPASGALKVAAMPPAAPQATSTRIRVSATRTSRPSVEPSAEPICTIGPSRPTEPPPPMHSAEASAFTAATCGAMRPPRRATAYITSGHAVAARLAGEEVDQRPVQQARHHRREDDEPDPETGDVRVGHAARSGVVGVARQQFGEGADQPAEHDRPAARAGSDGERQHQQAGVGRA